MRQRFSWPSSCIVAVLVTVWILPAWWVRAADWPRFRGPTGAGVSEDAQVPTSWSDTENLSWKLKLPGKGFSSPIVVGDRVFVTCYSDAEGDLSNVKRHLVCVHRHAGKVIWEKIVPSTAPEVSGPSFGTSHGFASHTPVSDGKHVFVMFGNSGVLAFDMQGNQLWQTSVGTKNAAMFGSASSPILYQDRLIVTAGAESESIRALDVATGKEVWKAESSSLSRCYSTPLAVTNPRGEDELLLSVTNELWSLDPDTGKINWRAKTRVDRNAVPCPIERDGICYIIGGRSGGRTAIQLGGKSNVTEDHIAWSAAGGSYVPSPLLHEGHLYWINDRGIAYCVDAATGKEISRKRVGGTFYASPVLIADKIYAVSRFAGTFVLQATPELTQLAHNQLSDTSDFSGSPAVSQGQLFLRSDESLYCVAPPNKAALPNVVVILADDLGYGDVQCYNLERGKIPTPHIDRLATQGMKFLDAHSSSGVCSPSRYTLLTGRYHWRTRLQSGIVGCFGSPLIDEDRLTIAGLVKPLGYHTTCIGKWHLGWDWNIAPNQQPLFTPGRGNFPEVTQRHRQAWQQVFSRRIAGGPTTRGFDQYFGTSVPNWPPYCFIEGDRTVGVPTTFLPAELFQNHLASLPGPAREGWELEGILPALADRACRYIQQQSETDQPFLLYLPLTSPHTPLAVNERWRNQSGLDSAVADLVMETDDVVGQVLAALQKNGLAENTLVIFTSDNGFAPYVGAKHLESRGHFPSGPFRGYKADAWEGGHRVPFIVRYPGRVAAGSVCDQLVHQADIMATIADLLGLELPPNAGEDSFNLWPLLEGSSQPVREHAVSHGSSGLPALRLGSWKLIYGPSGGGAWSKQSATKPDGQPAQLYDLTQDPGETVNLYAKHPEIVQKMIAIGQQIVSRGRSTPGPIQKNDVPVNWKRFLKVAR